MKKVYIYSACRFDRGDGISNVVLNLSSELDRNLDVTLIDFNHKEHHKIFIKNLFYKYKTINKIGFLSSIKNLLKMNDIVCILNGYYNIKYIWIMLICFFTNNSYVVIPHSSLSKESLERGGIKKRAFNYIFSFLLKGAKYIVFLNKSEAESAYLNLTNIVIIPNGVIISRNKSNKKFNKNNIKVSYIGRYDINHKGIDLLLNYIHNNDMESIKYNFYGSDATNQKNMISNMVDKYNIGSHVIINDAVFNNDKENVYLDSDLFIHTSRYEGMPISILEALSYGVPCIVSNGTNMADIIDKYKCGFIVNNQEDYNNVIEKIRNISSDEMQIYQNNARELIEKQYCWKHVATMYEKILD